MGFDLPAVNNVRLRLRSHSFEFNHSGPLTWLILPNLHETEAINSTFPPYLSFSLKMYYFYLCVSVCVYVLAQMWVPVEARRVQ